MCSRTVGRRYTSITCTLLRSYFCFLRLASSSFLHFLSAFIPRLYQFVLDFHRVKSTVGKSPMKSLWSLLETARFHSLSLSYFLVSLAISFSQSENCVIWKIGHSGTFNAGGIQVISWSLAVSLWFLLSFCFLLLRTKISWRPFQVGYNADSVGEEGSSSEGRTTAWTFSDLCFFLPSVSSFRLKSA